jgi:chorismate mutase
MSELENFRKKINEIDENIIRLLAERHKVVLAVGKYKEKADIEVVDLKREQQLREFYAELCTKNGLDIDFVNRLFKMVIMESRRLQETDKAQDQNQP